MNVNTPSLDIFMNLSSTLTPWSNYFHQTSPAPGTDLNSGLANVGHVPLSRTRQTVQSANKSYKTPAAQPGSVLCQREGAHFF